jgi:hypothetical protein
MHGRLLTPLIVGAALLVTTPAQAAPTPRQSLGNFAQKLERALTKKRCPGLKRINRYSELQLLCPSSSRTARRATKGFDVLGYKTYGTGGVIDFKDARSPDGASFVLGLGERRNWSIVEEVETGQRTTNRPSPADTSEVSEALGYFMLAVRDGDCTGYWDYSVTGDLDQEEACEAAFGVPDGIYIPLQDSLLANPNDVPYHIGGNPVFQFYGYQAGDTYRTAVVQRLSTAESWLVLATVRV